MLVFVSSRRRHTRCALVTGVQTCALPICAPGLSRSTGAPDDTAEGKESAMTLHSRVHEVTERLRERSRDSRAAYLDRLRRAAEAGPRRTTLSCGNLAHGFAACGLSDKQALKGAGVRAEEHTSELH